MKLGDQDRPWAPHVVCKTCIEHVMGNSTRNSMGPRMPMVWGSLQNTLATVTSVLSVRQC